MTDSRAGFLAVEPETGSPVVCFERSLPYPPKPVWDRLVDRAHLHEWLTTEPGGHIRHFVDGEVYLPTISGAKIDSFVYEFVPQRCLVFGWETLDWDGGEVTWELEPAAEGTLLTFEHDSVDLGPGHYARLLANWHLTLDLFEHSLAGAPQTWNWDAWEALCLHYARVIVDLIAAIQ